MPREATRVHGGQLQLITEAHDAIPTMWAVSCEGRVASAAAWTHAVAATRNIVSELSYCLAEPVPALQGIKTRSALVDGAHLHRCRIPRCRGRRPGILVRRSRASTFVSLFRPPGRPGGGCPCFCPRF